MDEEINKEMDPDYEYHKQNEYPGERIAEKKRVSDRAKANKKRTEAKVAEKGRIEVLKADNRVAQKIKINEKLMDSEIRRCNTRAREVNQSRNTTDLIMVLVGVSIIIVLLSGMAFGYTVMKQQAINQSDQIDYLNSEIVNYENNQNNQYYNPDMPMTSPINTACPNATSGPISSMMFVKSSSDSMSPTNNEMDVATDAMIAVKFNEDMDPSTINAKTFTVMQRTTPYVDDIRSLQLPGTITYNIHDRIATFKPDIRFYPNQEYGNVYTVTIGKGIKNSAGQPLQQDYIWSFTTGDLAYFTDSTTTQIN
ncbi:hypothetical protein COT47_01410 [Candidatus Woesearchaeota archaeon CG08_land_8_20_14_0_20_43_7]|nr:MAG: hypothetical protein COT47_01410 [Candidatus Woesearchaeota archaeon CG08_land_8_20_14_0_20_43_7]